MLIRINNGRFTKLYWFCNWQEPDFMLLILCVEKLVTNGQMNWKWMHSTRDTSIDYWTVKNNLGPEMWNRWIDAVNFFRLIRSLKLEPWGKCTSRSVNLYLFVFISNTLLDQTVWSYYLSVIFMSVWLDSFSFGQNGFAWLL